MTDKFIQAGIQRWEELATMLNNIVEEEGTIEINDERIWQGFLHKWSNDDWVLILLAMEQLFDKNPEYFKSYHEDAFVTARETLVKEAKTVERVMDRKRNKRHAWKMIMTMREVWNAVNNIHMPYTKVKPTKTTFSEVFE